MRAETIGLDISNHTNGVSLEVKKNNKEFVEDLEVYFDRRGQNSIRKMKKRQKKICAPQYFFEKKRKIHYIERTQPPRMKSFVANHNTKKIHIY